MGKMLHFQCLINKKRNKSKGLFYVFGIKSKGLFCICGIKSKGLFAENGIKTKGLFAENGIKTKGLSGSPPVATAPENASQHPCKNAICSRFDPC